MKTREIKLPFKFKKPVLALGAHTKNTVCFAYGSSAYLSSVHQDLAQPEDFLSFRRVVKHFLKDKPRLIAYDLHPGYQSSRYALNLPRGTHRLIGVQHHHAHLAACMVENGLKRQQVIGVAFDGTGLGLDGQLWGAEFFAPCTYRAFRRKAHLKAVPLLGAEQAISEPWRVVAAWLYAIYKDGFLNLDLPFVKAMDKKKWLVLKHMYTTGFNSPLTSSMGRLFDAAASLILSRLKVSSQAGLPRAMEEMAERYADASGSAHPGAKRGDVFSITSTKGMYLIDPAAFFRQVVLSLKEKNPVGEIAYDFHHAVAKVVEKTCSILRRESGINRVALSGGVFQNNLLLRLSLELLYKEGFEVFTHRSLSCSDSCISLGQAAAAYSGGI